MHEIQVVCYGRHHLRIAPQDLHFCPLQSEMVFLPQQVRYRPASAPSAVA